MSWQSPTHARAGGRRIQKSWAPRLIANSLVTQKERVGWNASLNTTTLRRHFCFKNSCLKYSNPLEPQPYPHSVLSRSVTCTIEENLMIFGGKWPKKKRCFAKKRRLVSKIEKWPTPQEQTITPHAASNPFIIPSELAYGEVSPSNEGFFRLGKDCPNRTLRVLQTNIAHMNIQQCFGNPNLKPLVKKKHKMKPGARTLTSAIDGPSSRSRICTRMLRWSSNPNITSSLSLLFWTCSTSTLSEAIIWNKHKFTFLREMFLIFCF